MVLETVPEFLWLSRCISHAYDYSGVNNCMKAIDRFVRKGGCGE